MEAWRRLRQREAHPPRRSPHRRLSRGSIILLVLLVLLVGFIAVLIIVSRDEQAATAAAATRAATLKDGDYAAIDVRDLTANPNANNQRSIQLRGEVTKIKKVGAGTQVLLSVPTRDGARREVFVRYGEALPGIAPGATITVFGVGDGMQRGRNGWASRDLRPVVRADRVVLQS